jgi:hypothetical protein
MQVSHARTLALLVSKQVLAKGQDQVFTEKFCELLAQLDPATSSWKMSPQLSRKVLTKLSKTWPAWGMTQGGCVYGHPMSGHLIKETDGLHWPTPTTSAMPCEGKQRMMRKKWVAGKVTLEEASAIAGRDVRKAQGMVPAMWPTPTMCGNYNRKGASATSGDGLATAVSRWPTPTAHNAKEGAYPAEYTLNTPTLASRVGGQLNPLWVEWLMGWPIGWTDSKQSETVKSRSKRRSPLPSWLTVKK